MKKTECQDNDWETYLKSIGADVDKTSDRLTVIGDVYLANCGLAKIPEELNSVRGTLDISLNPLENFKCNKKFEVKKMICFGNPPKELLDLNDITIIGFSEVDKKETKINFKDLTSNNIIIDGYEDIKKIKEKIEEEMFQKLEKKLPEFAGIFS